MCRQSTMINTAWQFSGEIAQVACQPLYHTTPLKLACYCFLLCILTYSKSILIVCYISAASVTSTALLGPDVITLVLMFLFCLHRKQCFFSEKVYSWGLWNLWIQTDLWLIRPWIQCCPWTSGKDSLLPPKQSLLPGLETGDDPLTDLCLASRCLSYILHSAMFLYSLNWTRCCAY